MTASRQNGAAIVDKEVALWEDVPRTVRTQIDSGTGLNSHACQLRIELIMS